MGEVRAIFQKEVLPSLFLNNQDVFFNAFILGPGNVKALLMKSWEDICGQNGHELQKQQIAFNVKYIIIDNSEINFTCLMIIELPSSEKVNDLAVYSAVYFGVNHNLRLFMGETDYSAKTHRYIWVVELNAEKQDIVRHNYGVLFRGCNNEPLLFAQPQDPEEPDRCQGINPEEELATFADIVAKICIVESWEMLN